VAHEVATRRFDLDDLGALVRKHHGRYRPRDHCREVQHANAF
jgi:hypothetical protein